MLSFTLQNNLGKSTLKFILEVEVEGVWPNLCYGNVESSATRWQVALHPIITVTQHRGGIVQILIQGSIFIDGNATMQKYIHVAGVVQFIGICRFRVPISHHSLGSVPLASSRSQLLREFIVRVGVGEWENGSCWGALGLVPTLLWPKPGMSPSSIWDAHLLASY